MKPCWPTILLTRNGLLIVKRVHHCFQVKARVSPERSYRANSGRYRRGSCEGAGLSFSFLLGC